jgi:hypothetical protein
LAANYITEDPNAPAAHRRVDLPQLGGSEQVSWAQPRARHASDSPAAAA